MDYEFVIKNESNGYISLTFLVDGVPKRIKYFWDDEPKLNLKIKMLKLLFDEKYRYTYRNNGIMMHKKTAH